MWGGKRQGSGRKGYDHILVTRSFRIRPEDAEFIKKTSEELGVSQAEVIHQLVDFYLESLNR